MFQENKVQQLETTLEHVELKNIFINIYAIDVT